MREKQRREPNGETERVGFRPIVREKQRRNQIEKQRESFRQRETEREGFRQIVEKQRQNQIQKQRESFRPIVREKQRVKHRERVLDR